MPANIQLETLHTFLTLTTLRPNWPGALILTHGLESQSIPFAANVAGAVCLTIDESPALCRAAMRSGACDFLVNTVDEALRVIKNEIRQLKPLSVALELNPQAAQAELDERGVLPQLFVSPEHPFPQAKTSWNEQSFSFESQQSLRAFDISLQSIIPMTDPRHRWLTAAPRLFPRDRTRHMALTQIESEALSTSSA